MGITDPLVRRTRKEKPLKKEKNKEQHKETKV